MTQFATIEKRDAAGRLVARVRVADGALDGPCVFYAEDGETVIGRTLFRAGLPLPADPAPVLPAPVPAGDASF